MHVHVVFIHRFKPKLFFHYKVFISFQLEILLKVTEKGDLTTRILRII